MTVQKQIREYIAAQPEPKRNEMQELHGIILALMPACKLFAQPPMKQDALASDLPCRQSAPNECAHKQSSSLQTSFGIVPYQ
jgi:hypothetical protein